MRQLLCSGCGAVNRIPEARNALEAKCGRCGARLFGGQPLDVDLRGLEAHLAASRGMGLLVDVWAPWCGPCRMMEPAIKQVAQELSGKVKVVKINIDDNQDLARQFGIQSVPTLMLFQHGKLLKQQAGALPYPQLKQWVERNLP